MTDAAKALPGLSAIAEGYDAVLSDVWGVIHNGMVAYPSAYEALAAYRRQGGRVVLITNAPRPAPSIIAMLDQLGVPKESYDAVVTSGDASRALISAYRGRVIHHVGPPTYDDALYEGLGVIRGPAEQAEAVVVTDLDTEEDRPEDYEARVAVWLERRLPMICANPDKVVESGDRLVYCGGALADLYEARGGTVHMAGKPFAPIYDVALAMATPPGGAAPARGRILAIGDSVRTDAQGAAGFGIDLLFITGSIHAAELDAFGEPDPAAVRALVAPSNARLAGFMPRLSW